MSDSSEITADTETPQDVADAIQRMMDKHADRLHLSAFLTFHDAADALRRLHKAIELSKS